MNIRSATADDVQAVLPMVDRACAFHEQLDPTKYGFLPNPGEMYRDWLIARAADSQSVFLVADAGSDPFPSVVGFLVGSVEREIPIYRVKQFGFIHELWVEERYRNEGIARQLVTLAIERFAAIGVPQLRLDVAWENPAARNLFAACGFRPTVVEMVNVLTR